MKKIIIILFFLVLTSPKIFAQFVDENFEYNVGDPISNYGWVPFSGIGINPILTCEPGLEFPCYECVFGNAACMTSTGEDVYKFLTRSVNSGSIYAIFMVKITSC